VPKGRQWGEIAAALGDLKQAREAFDFLVGALRAQFADFLRLG
jgi:hypothetical protein